MLATARTVTLVGLEAHPVGVEVQSGRGTATFDIVGLAEATVRESRVRVRAAIGQLGVSLASHALTVNLAPADLRKTGCGFDLAVAVATLAAIGDLDAESVAHVVMLGELSLTGALRPVRGVLPALAGIAAHGARTAIVPRANESEAAAVMQVVPDLDVRVADDLASVVAYLRGSGALDAPSSTVRGEPDVRAPSVDLADVRGQAGAKRALEIAAAGNHDLLFVGPPGAGKTMLARRMSTILPPLAEAEALEVTAIHSVAGTLPAHGGLRRVRPFRAPHHTVSDAGLLGGGEPPRPGELSLAHGGVLFLDEMPEFRRPALEGLRQPLEDGTITIARARSRATFPARPLVLGAMNPCPCGHLGAASRRCRCSNERVAHYRTRISGPIVDRLDLHVALPPVEISALAAAKAPVGESSQTVRARVSEARRIQLGRREVGGVLNARLGAREVDVVARPDARGAHLIEAAMARLGLSARAYAKILRLARTIADLEGADAIRAPHVAEAIEYRVLDRAPELPARASA
jgi:magnesium chelatase family protein